MGVEVPLGAASPDSVLRIDRFGSTLFTWTAGRLAACPFQLGSSDALEGGPCAGLDMGVIGAAGTPSTPNGRSGESNSLWVDAFAGLRFQIKVFGPLFLLGGGELIVPFTRPQFFFDPDTPVYSVPPLAGALFFGLLARFP